MERIPLYVDDMGESVFIDDLRAGLYFIRLRAKQGTRGDRNFLGRMKNKKKARVAEANRLAQAEQRADDLGLFLNIRAALDAEHIDINEPPMCTHFVPRTNRWSR